MTRPGDRLRIAHVHDIAFVASTLARAQRAVGHQVQLFEPWKPGASWPYPWKWLVAPLRAVSLLMLAVRLRRSRWDVIHVHSAAHAPAGAWSGAPFVVHCHGSDVRGVGPASPHGRIVGHYLRKATFVLYATPDLSDVVRSFRADAEFLPNPIDLTAFTPGAGRSRDLIIGVRLDPDKGAETVIEAAEMILRRRPATSVTVINHGPLADRARARLRGDVTVISPVPHDSLGAVLADHRIALGQFLTGAVGQYELESLACGTIVVCRFEFGACYQTPPPIVAVADAAAAAEATVRLLDRPQELEEQSRRGPTWVAAEHSAAKVVELLDQIYFRAAARRTRILPSGR